MVDCDQYPNSSKIRLQLPKRQKSYVEAECANNVRNTMLGITAGSLSIRIASEKYDIAYQNGLQNIYYCIQNSVTALIFCSVRLFTLNFTLVRAF